MASELVIMARTEPSSSNGLSHGAQRAKNKSPLRNRPRAETSRPQPISIPQEALNGSFASKNEEVEEEAENLGTEAAQSLVGVSIGREQTRLMSPTTPAAEKSAALDHMNAWGFFEDAGEDEQEVLKITLENSVQSPPETYAGEQDAESTLPTQNNSKLPTISLPSPWTSAGKPFDFKDESRLREQKNLKNRSRATSAASMLSDLSLKRLLPSGFSLPSISPKSGKIGQGDGTPEPQEHQPSLASRPSRSNSLFARNLPWSGSLSLRPRSRSRSRENQKSPSSRRDQAPGHRRIISSPLLHHSSSDPNGPPSSTSQLSSTSTKTITDGDQPAPTRLRRSASLESVPNSILSHVSSFGEDGRWDHIDEQVNTRLKAIKDTISDNLPSMPNINFGALRPDFTLRKDGPSPRAMSTVFVGSSSRSRQNSSAASTAPSSPMKKEFTSSRFPVLDEALENLTGDLVLMGGYRGSVLRSAEPPHRQLWVPIKVGLNMRKVDMEVGLEPEDEENMEKHIFPSGMLNHIGPIDISRRLFKRLRSCRNYRDGLLRVHDYGYDWRLSPELLSRKLVKFLEGLECNRGGVTLRQRGATVIAHSLGGLITRHLVNQRPELFAGVLYAGTPQHCVNILGPLRNGDDVLLSSRVLTAQVNFTLRTSFALLPESGQCFIDIDTKEQHRVDFFNVESWKQYAFSPCICRCLPAVSSTERRGILGSISDTISSISGSTMTSVNPSSHTTTDILSTKASDVLSPNSVTLDMQMNGSPPPVTNTTIPRDKALAYLERTLAETLRFKRALAHNPGHQAANSYPPHAVLYSTSMPTVYGARVGGRDGIRRADAYDNLAFASGDGVVLARAAMLPRGYRVAEGGRVRTERGHVGMLSDLEAVGKCLLAIVQSRREGVGLGADQASGKSAGLGLDLGGEGCEGEGLDDQERGRAREADGRGDGKHF